METLSDIINALKGPSYSSVPMEMILAKLLAVEALPPFPMKNSVAFILRASNSVSIKQAISIVSIL